MTHHLVPRNRVDVAAVERTGATALAFVVDPFLLLPIGVFVALVVPIVPFLPHCARGLDLFAEPSTTPRRFEHVFRYPVQVVLLFFGLINGGVAQATSGASERARSRGYRSGCVSVRLHRR